MRNRRLLTLLVLALAACDRLSSPSPRDAGVDSLATLWEQVDAGTVNYNAVAGSAPDNVFIVGDLGTILHWDGQSLLPETSGTTANLRGVAVVDNSVACAVGEQGAILRRQDGVWLAEPSPTTAVLNAVAVHTGTRLVAVGEAGTIVSNAQGAWMQVSKQADGTEYKRTDNYYAVTDSNAGVLIVGALGIVVRLSPDDQTIAETSTIAGYTKILAGATRYSSGALLVGVDGGYFYWSGGQATRYTGLPERFLRAISNVEGTAWIVGHEGLVARGPGSGATTLVPTPDERWLLGVYAAAARDVWVVGRSGLILRGPPGERGPGIDGGAP